MFLYKVITWGGHLRNNIYWAQLTLSSLIYTTNLWGRRSTLWPWNSELSCKMQWRQVPLTLDSALGNKLPVTPPLHTVPSSPAKQQANLANLRHIITPSIWGIKDVQGQGSTRWINWNKLSTWVSSNTFPKQQNTWFGVEKLTTHADNTLSERLWPTLVTASAGEASIQGLEGGKEGEQASCYTGTFQKCSCDP